MFFVFPDEFVFWRELPPDVHASIKSKYLPMIEEMEDVGRSNPGIAKWDSKLSCSMGVKIPFLWEEELINPVVWESADEMFQSSEGRISLLPSKSSLNDIWFNISRPGEYQEVHAHNPMNYSGIYLLHCNEPNNTSFYRPSARNEAYTTFTTGFMKEGTVILFPADLLHYVKPAKEKRVTLAFNLTCTF